MPHGGPDKPRQLSHGELEVVSPFFLSEKKELNREYQRLPDQQHRSLHSQGRARIAVDDSLGFEFPVHRSVDLVRRHQEGFKNRENIDLFSHLHRLFFKNKYFFDRKDEPVRKGLSLVSSAQDHDMLFSLTPAPLKRFIIEKNLLDIRIYEALLRKFEEERQLGLFSGLEVSGQKMQEEIAIINLNRYPLKEQSEHQDFMEERFLLGLLEKAETKGIRHLTPREIMEFRRIIEKRKTTLASLSESLGDTENMAHKMSPGHFRTRTMMSVQNTYRDNATTTKDSLQQNSEVQDKLARWKSVHLNGIEFAHHSEGGGDRKKTGSPQKEETKIRGKFQDMLSRLRKQKQQNNPRKKEFGGVGKMVLKLESVKLNLLKRLNLRELQGELEARLGGTPESQVLFSRYVSEIVAAEEKGLISTVGSRVSSGVSRGVTVYDGQMNARKQEIMREMMPVNSSSPEKKELKKTVGKIAKFHRFSLAVQSGQEMMKGMSIGSSSSQNQLLATVTQEEANMFKSPVKPSRFRTDSLKEEPKENGSSLILQQESSVLGDKSRRSTTDRDKKTGVDSIGITEKKPKENIENTLPKVEKIEQKEEMIEKAIKKQSTSPKKRFSEIIANSPLPESKPYRKSMVLSSETLQQNIKPEQRRTSKIKLAPSNESRKKASSMQKPSKFSRMSNLQQNTHKPSFSISEAKLINIKTNQQAEPLEAWGKSKKEEAADLVLESFHKEQQQENEKIIDIAPNNKERLKNNEGQTSKKKLITIKSKPSQKQQTTNHRASKIDIKQEKNKRKSIENHQNDDADPDPLIMLNSGSLANKSMVSSGSIPQQENDKTSPQVILERVTSQNQVNENPDLIITTPADLAPVRQKHRKIITGNFERKPELPSNEPPPKGTIEKPPSNPISRPISQQSIAISPMLSRPLSRNFDGNFDKSEKSFRFEDKTPVSPLLGLNSINIQNAASVIGSKKNIPFWEEENEKKGVSPTPQQKTEVIMKTMSKQNSFNFIGSSPSEIYSQSAGARPELLSTNNRRITVKKKRDEGNQNEGFEAQGEFLGMENSSPQEIDDSSNVLYKKNKKKRAETPYFQFFN